MNNSDQDDQPSSDEDLVARALEQARAARGQGHAAKLDATSISIPGYTILSEIHRGGQGAVYKAMQNGTRRTVAIKLMLRGAFAGDRERARFEREIRVLSQIRHPRVVSIYESGEADGRVYYVMEYVSGKPLDDYLNHTPLPLRDRLRLFERICAAVHAAHLQGVIHRDLKPDNIRIDASGEPHILDFGLAKVAGSLPENTDGQPVMMTMTGQFVGSLPWASPEQAEGVASRIDIRTDVYSLGVILYQMLTGRFPYTVEGTTREVLSSIVEAAPQRPRSLNRTIPSEVETITLRALAKERDRRYQSAGEFARDVERYLAGQPILARSDSLPYVLRKAFARHRVAAATMAIILLLIIGFGAGMTVLWNLARDRGDQLTIALDQREADLDFVLDILFGGDDLRQFARDRSVREVVDELAASADDRFEGDPVRLATLHEMLGRAYRVFDEPETAEPHLRRSLAMRTELFGHHHELTLGTQNTLAEVLKDRGIYREAASLYESIETALRSAPTGDAQSRRRLASVISNRARLLEQLDRIVEARHSMDNAIEVLATDADDPISGRLLLFARGHAAGLDSALGHCQKAADDMREIHSKIVAAFGPNHPASHTSRAKLARILLSAGEVQEAIDRLSEIPQADRTPEVVTMLAIAHARNRSTEEALTELSTANIPPFERAYTEAAILFDANRYAESRSVLDAMNIESLPPLERFRVLALRVEINLALDTVEVSEADRLITLSTRLYGPEEPMTVYGAAIKALSNNDEPPLRRCLRDLSTTAGEHHILTVNTSMLLAQELQRQNKQGEANALLRPLVSWSNREHALDHPLTRRLERAATAVDPI